MKILVNALSARKGGIVTYTRNLFAAFRDLGIDATIAVPREFEAPDDAATYRLDVSHFSPLRRFLWEQFVWRRIVARLNPDVLFSSANFGLLRCPVPQVLLLREGGLFDPRYLADFAPEQGTGFAFSRAIRRRLMLASAERADHIITPTAAIRELVASWRPAVAAKCSIIPYGTILNKFSGEGRRRWREDGVLRLLYVSVYYPHKLPGLVCQAVQALNEAGIRAHATITMAEEELPTMLGSAADEAGVPGAAAAGLVTLGHVDYDKLPDLYNSHDLFLFPSMSETFGHPMAEAMSSGMPMLVSDTPVNREICGEAALYFAPYAVSEIVERVREFDADPALRERLAASGRARVEANYSWQRHVERLVETLEQVARDGRAPN